MSQGSNDRLLIVEELHLLLVKPEGGLETVPAYRAYAETAALLVDLAVAGAVTVGEKETVAAQEDARGPEHPVLRQGWSALAEGGPGTVGELVRRPELDPGGTVEESLVAAGILERKSRGVLGLRFDRTPTVDPAPEGALRARLAAVLAGRERATVADTSLLALLNAGADAPRILRAEAAGMDRDQFAARVRELDADTTTSDAVSDAISAVSTAVIGAVLVPTIIGGIL